MTASAALLVALQLALLDDPVVQQPVGAGAFGRVAGRLRGLFKEFL